MKKIIIAILILIVVAGAAAYFIVDEKTDLVTTEESVADFGAKDFLAEYIANKADADAKYLNKTIVVSGNIANITPMDDKIIVEIEGKDALESVSCNFDQSAIAADKPLKIGDAIKFKGNCAGFTEDDLMGIKTITMVQCLPI